MEKIVLGQIRNGYEVIPREKRKKVMILSDDARLASGVGCVSKEIILGIIHSWNAVQLGGAINHPEKGKVIDMSSSLKTDFSLEDGYFKIYPVDGYGDQQTLRQIMQIEQPDVIMHFTDPRFFGWLYAMEHEIRRKIPLTYLNIWDDLPYPHWNAPFYSSCDLLMSISKQTYAINKYVLGEENIIELDKEPHNRNNKHSYIPNKSCISYVPHGINEEIFHPINKDSEEYKQVINQKFELFGDIDAKDFVLFYNARNIRRKMTSDVILAFKTFCDKLPKEISKKCVLVMHTQTRDDNGTNLLAVKEAICPEYDVILHDKIINQIELNILYNLSDVTINIASNEGFGLGTAESLMCGTPIIVNVTGGLQDQCGFVKDDGTYITEHDLTSEWATNHDRKYKNHGCWVKPVFPACRCIQGSIPTPYIFDDRCDWEEVADAIHFWFDKTYEERKDCGLSGREWMTRPEIGLGASEMCKRVMDNFKYIITNYQPRNAFELFKVEKKVKKILSTAITLRNKD